MRLLCTLILLLGLSAQAQITISNATLSGVTSGSALLSANQAFTGSNTFSGGMMVWGDGNKTNGVWIGPSGEVLSNTVGTVTIAGGNVTASGVVKATNGLAPGILTVATLPASPVAGQTCWASDVVTSRGSGGHVYYDGTNWRVMGENVVAGTDLTNWAFNGWSAGLNCDTPVAWVRNNAWPFHNTFVFGYNPGGTGTGNSEGMTLPGSLSYGQPAKLTCGTVTGNYAYGSGMYFYWSAAVTDVTACGVVTYVDTAANANNKYWSFYGISTKGANTGWPPAGAWFGYDMYTNCITTLPTDATATYTNNWICCSAQASTYTYVDSGLPVSTSSATPNRLMVVLGKNGAIFYTNGVLSKTITANVPTTQGLFVGNASQSNIVYTSGQAIQFYQHPYFVLRHAAETIP